MNPAAARVASLILPLLALWSTGLLAAGTPTLEDRRIEYLISTIAALRDVQFIRNGTAYDSHAAADHLRRKRLRAGSRVVTVEDFIRDCASASAMSGQPYRIRYADGHEVTSEAFLRAQLANFRGAVVRDPCPALAGAP